MASVRRSRYFFLVSHDKQLIDIDGLLRGEVNLTSTPTTSAISIIAGKSIEISADAVGLLQTLPGDSWLDERSVPASARAQLRELTDNALALTDEPSKEYEEYLRRHQVMESDGWDPYAALFHFMTRWGQMDLFPRDDPAVGVPHEGPPGENSLARFWKSLGRPPSHFHSVPHSAKVVELPVERKTGELYDILAARKTTRGFDTDASVTIDELSTLLYYVFGCHGYAYASPGLVNIHKTSPSGGSLHPIEAYPLVMNVQGLDPGLYHYNVARHSLDLIRDEDLGDARATARVFLAGQTYFSSASSVILLTSRFPRNQWKYRFNTKTYGVMLMDAGHLSQTFYLVPAELGLGAFVTGAINNKDIDSAIGIDGFAEGALVALGCGRAKPAAARVLQPEFFEYRPRETRLEPPASWK